MVVESVEDFLENFECVGSFSQDKKEPNSIVVPGCPPLLDWRKMEAEEGEITLVTGIFILFLGPFSVVIPSIYINYGKYSYIILNRRDKQRMPLS